jgi:hypothetical protein
MEQTQLRQKRFNVGGWSMSFGNVTRRVAVVNLIAEKVIYFVIPSEARNLSPVQA